MRTIDRQAIGLVALTVVADQVSKELLLRALLKAGASIGIIDGLFQLVVVWNRGVSFGLMGGNRALPPWVLSAVAIAVCIALFVWLRRTDRRFTGWGIGLVMGRRHRQCYRPGSVGRGLRFCRFPRASMALAGVQHRRFRDRRGGGADADRFLHRRAETGALIRP